MNDMSNINDANAHSPPAENPASRPWVGVQFDCCGVYTRVYRRPDQLRYVLRCPKCLRQTTIQVAPGGSSDRMFRFE